ncbi:MAG: HPr(Ser) kinase/phosphatase [candidate division Zixibacteria bacterium]|nr:HPr(Ser) kinase/phosphatase [candidate division Zixibacteria bacterium]
MDELTVYKLYKSRNEDLELTLLSSNEEALKKEIFNAELHRPGLALTGFMERFPNRRIQVLGETEMAFISRLNKQELNDIAEVLFGLGIPMIIVTKGITPPMKLIQVADNFKTPIFSTRLNTTELSSRLSAFLDNYFAPSINTHGTLVDVYGVGLLYTGKSGIGKSEIALDLVERGHRLVADDVVKVTRTASDVIIGGGSELLGHHMEIRGIGIIDIEELFGIRSIRMQKRIEVEVSLCHWSDTDNYERLGLEDHKTTLLGVSIPIVKIPISPGKNITVISEVIAMNHMLKVYGENSAVEFTKKLSQKLGRQRITMDYLESDFE